jgi:hypothetical protein
MSEDLAVIHADKVKPQRVDWLWPRYIAFRKLTVKDGDPGLGKSVITVDLTARVSTGSPFPDGARPDGAYRVLLLSAEDGVEDTIVPRLVVAGANLANVDILDHVNDGTGPRPVELPGDLPRIRELVKGEGHALVVIDPLMAFLAGEVNAHRDQDVRRALHPLKLMAEATGAAVLVVRHLNKMTGASALYRGGGSIGIVGAARAGLLVAPDPDDETETRRVLAVTKSNLAAKPPSLAYRIVGDDLYDNAKVAWEGASEHTAEGLLGRPVEREAPARTVPRRGCATSSAGASSSPTTSSRRPRPRTSRGAPCSAPPRRSRSRANSGPSPASAAPARRGGGCPMGAAEWAPPPTPRQMARIRARETRRSASLSRARMECAPARQHCWTRPCWTRPSSTTTTTGGRPSERRRVQPHPDAPAASVPGLRQAPAPDRRDRQRALAGDVRLPLVRVLVVPLVAGRQKCGRCGPVAAGHGHDSGFGDRRGPAPRRRRAPGAQDGGATAPGPPAPSNPRR